jgi:hypothetical protein
MRITHTVQRQPRKQLREKVKDGLKKHLPTIPGLGSKKPRKTDEVAAKGTDGLSSSSSSRLDKMQQRECFDSPNELPWYNTKSISELNGAPQEGKVRPMVMKSCRGPPRPPMDHIAAVPYELPPHHMDEHRPWSAPVELETAFNTIAMPDSSPRVGPDSRTTSASNSKYSSGCWSDSGRSTDTNFTEPDIVTTNGPSSGDDLNKHASAYLPVIISQVIANQQSSSGKNQDGYCESPASEISMDDAWDRQDRRPDSLTSPGSPVSPFQAFSGDDTAGTAFAPNFSEVPTGSGQQILKTLLPSASYDSSVPRPSTWPTTNLGSNNELESINEVQEQDKSEAGAAQASRLSIDPMSLDQDALISGERLGNGSVSHCQPQPVQTDDLRQIFRLHCDRSLKKVHQQRSPQSASAIKSMSRLTFDNAMHSLRDLQEGHLPSTVDSILAILHLAFVCATCLLEPNEVVGFAKWLYTDASRWPGAIPFEYDRNTLAVLADLFWAPPEMRGQLEPNGVNTCVDVPDVFKRRLNNNDLIEEKLVDILRGGMVVSTCWRVLNRKNLHDPTMNATKR